MSKPRLVRWLFAACAFLSSFELFLIEPMQGKMLLPLFGGAPAIWNTCMVFFQALLLCGYVYAHFTTSKLSVVKQLGLQLSVLALPLFFLPIALPSLNIQTEWLSTEPVKWLLVVLVLTTGAAFFAVSMAVKYPNEVAMPGHVNPITNP